PGHPAERYDGLNADGASTALSARAVGPLFRAIGAVHVDAPTAAPTGHADPPRIAAHLAVLHEAALHVGLDIDLQLLTAIGTCHEKFVSHRLSTSSPRFWVATTRAAGPCGGTTITVWSMRERLLTSSRTPLGIRARPYALF